MKKVLCVLAVFICILTTAAAEVDLSGMSYDELVALKDQINKAIWESDEWQEVTVPQGVWRVGKDIPAGHWTVKAADGAYVSVDYCEKITAMGKADWSGKMRSELLKSPTRSSFSPTEDRVEFDQEMVEGMYLVIDDGSVIFTPYSGKPSLGFK